MELGLQDNPHTWILRLCFSLLNVKKTRDFTRSNQRLRRLPNPAKPNIVERGMVQYDDDGQRADSNVSNRAQESKWGVAKNVLTATRVSSKLDSLRDRLGDTNIDIGELKVSRRLGEGAFATVDLATWKGKLVAVKKLHKEMLDDENEILMFVAEAKLLRKLRHSCIVAFIGAGGTENEDGDLFLVQEYCSGGSLREVLGRQMTEPFKKHYSEELALKWCTQIAAALAYLHEAKPKIIHRDLKLDNCLLTDPSLAKADAKLADFGLAKMMRHSQNAAVLGQRVLERIASYAGDSSSSLKESNLERNATIDSVLIRSQTFSEASIKSYPSSHGKKPPGKGEMTGRTGSFGYMAPEVLRGEQYDEAADIFSFAMVMYNLFHRTIPSVHLLAHGGYEDIEIYAAEVANGYRPPLSHTVPSDVQNLIAACWEPRPLSRPRMKDVYKRLKLIRESGVCNSTASSGGCCNII